MTVEAAVAVISGIIAASIALVGFGVDSVIEFFAAAVVIWQLRGGEEREIRAVHLIGITFFVPPPTSRPRASETSSVTPGPNTRYRGSP
jgi:hypothetical protein